jgi:hypothetical protein
MDDSDSEIPSLDCLTSSSNVPQATCGRRVPQWGRTRILPSWSLFHITPLLTVWKFQMVNFPRAFYQRNFVFFWVAWCVLVLSSFLVDRWRMTVLLCEHTLLISGEVAQSNVVHVAWPAKRANFYGHNQRSSSGIVVTVRLVFGLTISSVLSYLIAPLSMLSMLQHKFESCQRPRSYSISSLIVLDCALRQNVSCLKEGKLPGEVTRNSSRPYFYPHEQLVNRYSVELM